MSLELSPGQIAARGLWKRFRADRGPRSALHPWRAFHRPGWRWALQDVDLDIAPGSSVGLVGPNGSGKSTLLKLLCGVMYPYAGTIEVAGEIGPMIEVQAGLHPDLTGRQNVDLYGAFLGIDERRIRDRFDEIVDFAELGDAIDRPLRFYSSGMKMRLGFAVATLLEPHVLLIDEILAVGDAAFQQRCLEQLQRSHRAGTTLVFVSHDAEAVRAVCERAVWLDGGRVQMDGPVDAVLSRYREAVEDRSRRQRSGDGPVAVTGVRVNGGAGVIVASAPVEIAVALDTDRPRRVRIHVGLSEGPAAPLLALERELALPAGPAQVVIELDHLPFGRGHYALWLGVSDERGDELVAWRPEADLDLVGPDADHPPAGVARLAPLSVPARWNVEISP